MPFLHCSTLKLVFLVPLHPCKRWGLCSAIGSDTFIDRVHFTVLDPDEVGPMLAPEDLQSSVTFPQTPSQRPGQRTVREN